MEKLNTYNPISEFYNNENNEKYENYQSEPVIRICGIISLILFIAVVLAGAIGHMLQISVSEGMGNISLILFFGCSEIPLSLIAIPSLYFLITRKNKEYNRIFYQEVHLIHCALLIFYCLSSLINCIFLYYYTTIQNELYNFYKIPLNIITLIIGTVIYVKIKSLKNLPFPAIMSFYSFISQIISFTLYALVFHIYLLFTLVIDPYIINEALIYFDIFLAILILIISLFVIIYYKDPVFGCGYFGYQFVKILYEYDFSLTVNIVHFVCLGIGIIAIGYVTIRFKKQCLGME